MKLRSKVRYFMGILSQGTGKWFSVLLLASLPSAIDLYGQNLIDEMSARKNLLTGLLQDSHTILRDGDDSFINDGGADMYDSGNFILTDRSAAAMRYQFEEVVADSDFGDRAKRKYIKIDSGIFLLAVQDMDISSFKVKGNLGADGRGFSKNLTFNVEGYRAFGFGTYGTSDASVNHLILVEDNGTAAHTPPSSTEEYVHEVSGLAGAKKLIFILFATKNQGSLTSEVPLETFQLLAQRAVSGLQYSHRCVVKNLHAFCWGSNKFGELGLGVVGGVGTKPHQLESLPPVDLGSSFNVKSVDTGNGFSCATSDTGRVKCWGSNTRGQLGVQDTVARGLTPESMGENLPEPLFQGAKIRYTRHGLSHTCALAEEGSVFCWGANDKGQLGQGHVLDIGDEVSEKPEVVDLGNDFSAVALSCGNEHCCAASSLGQLKCWGDNSLGQLGLGDSEMRGASPEQMGDQLPFVNLGSGFKVAAVSLGGVHSCVLSEEGELRCFGDGADGKLGNGSLQSVGITPESMGEGLHSVDLGSDQIADSVSCGQSHCCAKLIQQTLKCWGGNSFGMLGYGDTIARGDSSTRIGDLLPMVPFLPNDAVFEVNAKGPSTCTRTQRGLICWGYEATGMTGNGLSGFGSTGSTPKTIPARLSPLPF